MCVCVYSCANEAAAIVSCVLRDRGNGGHDNSFRTSMKRFSFGPEVQRETNTFTSDAALSENAMYKKKKKMPFNRWNN